ncbi:MAG: NADP-dependent malic enzyme [Pseudomonadota bacterium]
MMTQNPFSDEEALLFHAQGKPGKLEMQPTKPMSTQRDLSLAYSPGVAVPVRVIAEDPDRAYEYTAKANLVAVISNGTAILGLGNLGPLASKPVMEGKAVLFKRFADVDSIDLEVDVSDAEEFIRCVRPLGPSFGGINLEDIKAPDCFIIEQALRESMDIPVFHDDQHGTAIISAAGLINAMDLTKRSIRQLKVVVNGAGSAGIACLELLKAMGLPNENAILCDSKGVIYQGRQEGMNQWKTAHAVDTSARTLADALDGADVFLGLSVQGAVTADMVQSMADKPIIFAMANPDPEITPGEVKAVRDDAIIATGRSDFPNQVNNVLGFPYIFRGALDVRARTINEAMKIAAAQAIAELARQDVPDEVASAYQGSRLRYGPDYIIPVPFDPRLISHVPPAVARAAMDTGVARSPIIDMTRYRSELSARLDPTAGLLQKINESVKANPKRVVFAEGEEAPVIRAAILFQDQGLGTPVLIGRRENIVAIAAENGLELPENMEIVHSRDSDYGDLYSNFLYARLQRDGFLLRDAQRMVFTNRNIYGACMVAQGHADALLSGVTRNYQTILDDLNRVFDRAPGHIEFGMSIILARGRTVFVADTNVREHPSPEDLADTAIQAAAAVRRLGYEPRVAFLAYSTFGYPKGERSTVQRKAVELLDEERVDFEYEGEMSVDVALGDNVRQLYPFSRLTGPANVMIMPGLHSANIATKMMEELSTSTVIGPLLLGLEKSAQICPLGAKVSTILDMAAMAAFDLSPKS